MKQYLPMDDTQPVQRLFSPIPLQNIRHCPHLHPNWLWNSSTEEILDTYCDSHYPGLARWESNVFKLFDSILVHQFIMGANVQKHQDCINKGIFWDSRRPIVVSGGQEDMHSSRCFTVTRFRNFLSRILEFLEFFLLLQRRLWHGQHGVE